MNDLDQMSDSIATSTTLALPAWVREFVEKSSKSRDFSLVEDRMRLAIDLARTNVVCGTGGPFGAAIFDMRTHALVSVGVNIVAASNCSMGHAEVMAIMLAQAHLSTFDLGGGGSSHELVTSAQMCAMCNGSTIWSGVRSVVVGASARDTEEITGFDEGPLPADWAGQLKARGISVITDCLRYDACDVLRLYVQKGAVIYNGRASTGEVIVAAAPSIGEAVAATGT